MNALITVNAPLLSMIMITQYITHIQNRNIIDITMHAHKCHNGFHMYGMFSSPVF